MSAIFVGLLVMFLLNGQSTAQELPFVSINKMVELGTSIFNHLNETNIELMLKSAELLKSRLVAWETHEHIELRTLLGTLRNDIEISKSLSETPDLFDSVIPPHVNPEFLTLVLEKTTQHRPTDCQRFLSPQQLMYYIYVQLMLTELKDVVSLMYMHAAYNRTSDLDDARVNFETRVREYHELFIEHLAHLPKGLYRCHVNTPIRGLDFLELQKFSQIKFLETNNRKKKCDVCPHPLMIYEIARRMGTEVYNCMTLGNTVTVCPAENGSVRNYLWWKDEAGTYYGKNTPCTQEKQISAGWYNGLTSGDTHPIVKPCALCACSVDEFWGLQDSRTHIWRITDMKQISDIWNDMVVTGMKFVIRDNAIHLQIQQAKFSQSGTIYSDVAWKELDTEYHKNGTIQVHAFLLRHRFTSQRKTMHLDDIIVPKDSVVTGVRFVKSGLDAFTLQVHATRFNLETGKLNPSVSFWCESAVCNNESPTDDYKRERIEIKMDHPDDPTRGVAFNYDPEANKMIKFTHTDLYKDGGQTTVPFFDAQPVQVQPVFPLSGVGLYYRGAKGFGGYIAPRIHTLDVTNYMRIPQVEY